MGIFHMSSVPSKYISKLPCMYIKAFSAFCLHSALSHVKCWMSTKKRVDTIYTLSTLYLHYLHFICILPTYCLHNLHNPTSVMLPGTQLLTHVHKPIRHSHPVPSFGATRFSPSRSLIASLTQQACTLPIPKWQYRADKVQTYIHSATVW